MLCVCAVPCQTCSRWLWLWLVLALDRQCWSVCGSADYCRCAPCFCNTVSQGLAHDGCHMLSHLALFHFSCCRLCCQEKKEKNTQTNNSWLSLLCVTLFACHAVFRLKPIYYSVGHVCYTLVFCHVLSVNLKLCVIELHCPWTRKTHHWATSLENIMLYSTQFIPIQLQMFGNYWVSCNETKCFKATHSWADGLNVYGLV